MAADPSQMMPSVSLHNTLSLYGNKKSCRPIIIRKAGQKTVPPDNGWHSVNVWEHSQYKLSKRQQKKVTDIPSDVPHSECHIHHLQCFLMTLLYHTPGKNARESLIIIDFCCFRVYTEIPPPRMSIHTRSRYLSYDRVPARLQHRDDLIGNYL